MDGVPTLEEVTELGRIVWLGKTVEVLVEDELEDACTRKKVGVDQVSAVAT